MKVFKLKKQSCDWRIVKIYSFSNRNYSIDNQGNFFSNGILRRVKPDIKGNYWHFLIDDKGKKVRFKKHQIVLQTFYPEGMKDYLSIDHIDRNRHNNNLLNLRYATRKQQYENRENIEYKNKPVFCLNNNTIYESSKIAEEKLKITKNTVARVARKQRKNTNDFVFEFLETTNTKITKINNNFFIIKTGFSLEKLTLKNAEKLIKKGIKTQ